LYFDRSGARTGGRTGDSEQVIATFHTYPVPRSSLGHILCAWRAQPLAYFALAA